MNDNDDKKTKLDTAVQVAVWLVAVIIMVGLAVFSWFWFTDKSKRTESIINSTGETIEQLYDKAKQRVTPDEQSK